ncbi:MAG TPA: hypothetical protein VK705_09975 [Ferruginibacter sp.]|jgi:hypothetical protein|nr:hypothetical protein [Ferruginibacter sp.]
MIKKITHIIVLSCRKATQLIEKKLHTELSARERVQLKLHKGICDACTLYEKQVVFIEKILKKDSTTPTTEQTIPDKDVQDLQAKIIRSIEK